MLFNKLPPRKNKGSVILINALITGIVVGMIGISIAKLNGMAFQSKLANNIALQAQYHAASKGLLLETMKYSELASQRRADISGSDFQDEVTVSPESDYSSNIKKKDIEIKVYKEGDVLPRSRLMLTRYNKVDEEVGGCQIATGTNSVSVTANGTYKSVTIIASSKFTPADGTWTGIANFNVAVNGANRGSLTTTTTTSKGGSKGHYWGTTEAVTEQKTISAAIAKGNTVSVSLVNSTRHSGTTLTVILGS